MWKQIEEYPIPQEQGEVLGQNDKWIDEYNSHGIRVGFIGGDGDFISAKWDNNQDTYFNQYGMPTKWMKLPVKYERLEKIFDALFEEIKHGDSEHQDWLRNKLNDFLQKLIQPC